MSGTEWLAVVGGIAAIAWVNWYFLFAERGTGPVGGSPGEKKEEG